MTLSISPPSSGPGASNRSRPSGGVFNPNLLPVRQVGPAPEPMRAVLLTGDPVVDALEVIGRAIDPGAARRAARPGPDGLGGWLSGVVQIRTPV